MGGRKLAHPRIPRGYALAVPRLPARLAVIGLFLVLGAGCGGGSDRSDAAHPGVEAFPDVLEIARAELGEDAFLSEVAVTENTISFVHVQFGRNVRVVYNSHAVFVGNERVRKRVSSAAAFPISDVPLDAPRKLLAAIQQREEGDVSEFGATLLRDRTGALRWDASATVEGVKKRYKAALDGTLRG